MTNIHNLTSFCIFSKNFSHSLLKVKKRGRRDAPCSGPRPVLTPVLLSLPGVGPVQLGPDPTRVPTQPANARPARNTLHSQLISPRQLQIQMKIQLQLQIQIQMIIQIQILNQLYLQDNCVRVNILSHITYICI